MKAGKEITYKDFTVREVYDALVQNGLQHLRKNWLIKTFDGKLTGGCILGQGAYNLSVLPHSDDEFEDMFPIGQYMPKFSSEDAYDDDDYEDQVIDTQNKFVGFGLYDQLNKFDNVSEKWSADITGGCGEAIVYWNDLQDTLGHWDAENRKYIQSFVLETYEEVLEAAKDILAPYMDEVIRLAVIDYSWNPNG